MALGLIGGAILGISSLASTINSGINSHLDREQNWKIHEQNLEFEKDKFSKQLALDYYKINSGKLAEYNQMKQAGINLGADLGTSSPSMTFNSNSAEPQQSSTSSAEDIIVLNSAKKLISRHKKEFASIYNQTAKRAYQSNLLGS